MRSHFFSTTGVMTREAGAVTGELELATRVDDGRLHVRVRYAGAGEWYAVAGSPVVLRGDHVETGHEELHLRVLRRQRTPGPVVDGNEEAVSFG